MRSSKMRVAVRFGDNSRRARITMRAGAFVLALILCDAAPALDPQKSISQFTQASIPTAYYQTSWFRVASIIALGFLLFVFYKLRLRRIRRHNAELLRENSERQCAEAALEKTRAYMAASESLSLTGSFSWNVASKELAWSDEMFRIYGFDPSIKPTFERLRERIHPDDLKLFDRTAEQAAREVKDREFCHRIVMPDGSIKHLEILAHAAGNGSGTFTEYVGAVKDVTERKQAGALLTGEKRLLEMIATGVPLASILDVLCKVIEEQRIGLIASVLLLNQDGIHLHPIAGSSLPEGWTQLIDGLAIGPCVGSCGTAAFRGEAVIVSDIATDPLWDVPEYRAAALRYGLRASWSNPILSSEGKVLGTFAMYYREIRSPSAHDLDLIELATHLARVAIERDCAEEALRRSENFLAEGEAISETGTWGWNLTTGKIVWSDEQCRMLGFDVNGTEPTLDLFLERVHPEDRARIRQTIEEAIEARRAYEMEYRVALPDGSVKHFQTRAHPVTNPSGETDEYIGITMDVTKSKRAADAVRASEQVARGQVEALVQSLDILATAPPPEKFIGQMLSTIGRLLSAQSVILWLLDEATESVVLRAGAHGANLAAIENRHPFVTDPMSWKENEGLQEMLFTGVAQACDDVETDPRISNALRDYFRSNGTKKFLTIPTMVGGGVNGFIGIRHGDRPPYRPEEIELAQALAHQAMFAIQLNEFAEQGRRAAVLEERNRMARDIHDTIAQGLTGVIVQLQAAEDATAKGYKKEAQDHLQNARQLARQGLSEARRSVRALRPQALEDATFWEAFQSLIKNAAVGTALQTEFEVRGKMRELSPLAQENLLHIGQEALTNTLKYARATRFETHLSFTASEVRLELRDNGVGFKVNDGYGGFGLTGMRERVEQMNGTLTVSSTRGKGTSILVVSPNEAEAVA